MKQKQNPADLFQILENADDETLLQMSKQYTAASPEEMERIFKKSQEKYQFRTSEDKIFKEEIPNAPKEKRNFYLIRNTISVAACVALTFFGIHGIMNMKSTIHPEQETPSETIQEKNESSETIKPSEIPETTYIPEIQKETVLVYYPETEPFESESETATETETEKMTETETETVPADIVTIVNESPVLETQIVITEETVPVPTTEPTETETIPETEPETELETESETPETEPETEEKQEKPEYSDFIVTKKTDTRDASIVYEKITPVLDENAPEMFETYYAPAWIPEGSVYQDDYFTQIHNENDNNNVPEIYSKQYQTANGKKFTFHQYLENPFNTLFKVSETDSVGLAIIRKPLTVNGSAGYYYEISSSGIVMGYSLYWKQDGYVMSIESYGISLEETIQMAESVTADVPEQEQEQEQIDESDESE